MKKTIWIIWLLCTSSIYGIEKPRTDIGSFVHQITLERDSTETQLTQWVTPLSVHLPFANGAIHIHSAAMLVHQDAQVDDQVWGALNTNLSGYWTLGKTALLSLNTSLPTGKHALATTDADLVQSLTRNDLNFPIKTFGQGFDFGGTFSLVRHRGFWTWSAGVGYQRKGTYEPIAGVTDYKPGDEVSGSFGFDYTYGSFVYRFSAAGTYFFTDRQNRFVVFQNGKQILVQNAILYTGNRFRVKAEITEIARLKNQEIINGAFVYESRDSNGNDLRAQLETSWTPIRYFTIYGLGYAKHLTANARPAGSPLYQGDAYLIEGGGGVAFTVGPYHLNLRASKLTGKAEDKQVALSAINLRCSFTAEF
ncbi:MAG: hypothetical protein HOE48_26440 [Candidatus Latescibacteria bacterium]|jgi:hypothetical protein|nr:hypothetical protein [Candidatus Latescibacterota bacterium]MBT4141472.1 hypothetical protein [Candidatus Latescibacterota bacterium]MBT5829827.1 hypothetical protein [Candidatus Latescibacterota bacterium]